MSHFFFHKDVAILIPCVGDFLVPFKLSGPGCHVGSNSRQVLVDEDLAGGGCCLGSGSWFGFLGSLAGGGQSALGTMVAPSSWLSALLAFIRASLCRYDVSLPNTGLCRLPSETFFPPGGCDLSPHL